LSQANTSSWTQADWRANASSGIDDYGGSYDGATCVTMTNNMITNVSFGIETQRSENVLIKGNTIDYFLHTAIPYGSNHMVIENNLMTNRIDAGDIAEFHPQFMRGTPWGSGSPAVDHLSNVVIDSNIGIRQTDPNLPFTGPSMAETMGFDIYNGVSGRMSKLPTTLSLRIHGRAFPTMALTASSSLIILFLAMVPLPIFHGFL